MRWRNTETPTFIGSRGTRNSGPDVVEILELLDRNGNVVATFGKAVDGSGSLTLTGDLSVSEPIAQDQIEGTLVQILASVSVNLNQGTAAKQPLYTVPVGKKLITTVLILRMSGVRSVAVIAFGFNAAADNMGEPNITGATTLKQVTGDDLAFIEGTAGQVLGLAVTTPEGSPLTASVDVLGYLISV